MSQKTDTKYIIFRITTIFFFFLFLTGCQKDDSLITETTQSYEELKFRFFNIYSTEDFEIKKLACDIRKQDSIFKFLPDFIKNNGIPKWDKVFYKTKQESNLGMKENIISNSTSTPYEISKNESNNNQGIFFIPLQSQNSNEIKSYIAAIKHNDSLYSYKLYNKDSLNKIVPKTKAEENNLLTALSVFGHFEKTINNNEIINIGSSRKGTIKNVRISFEPPISLYKTNSSYPNVFITTCTMSITVYVIFEYYPATSLVPDYYELVAVELLVEIYCSVGGVDGFGGGGGSFFGGGTSSSDANWWNSGSGWPWNSGGENWRWWWTSGGYGGGSSSYSDFNRTDSDFGTGDDDNNSQGNYDNTNYSDYDNQIQPWPTIQNVIPILNFVGWNNSLHPTWQCMDYAKAQIAKKGYSISNYSDAGQTVQIYTEANGVNKNAAKNAVGYLISALQRGIPIIVGVDDEAGSPNPNTDNTTDHFIVIVGTGSDTNGTYFTFYDNASGDPNQGADTKNKLYYDPSTGLISGKSQTVYAKSSNRHDYIVTMIRKSK